MVLVGRLWYSCYGCNPFLPAVWYDVVCSYRRYSTTGRVYNVVIRDGWAYEDDLMHIIVELRLKWRLTLVENSLTRYYESDISSILVFDVHCRFSEMLKWWTKTMLSQVYGMDELALASSSKQVNATIISFLVYVSVGSLMSVSVCRTPSCRRTRSLVWEWNWESRRRTLRAFGVPKV